MHNTKVILLGTGTPNTYPNRNQTSTAVVVDDNVYIIDCGAGMRSSLWNLLSMGHDQFRPANLTRLFITHLHPDHTTGMPSFIIDPWVLARSELQIFGPPGIQKLTDHIIEGWAPGIAEHQFRGVREMKPLNVTVQEYRAGLIYKDDLVEVEAFKVDHGGLETHGMKFTIADGKKLVFSADTCASPVVVEQARGCDFLLHECFSEEGLKGMPEIYEKYFHRVHTSGRSLGEMAKEIRPKQLVIHHQMVHQGKTREDLVQEILSTGYDGSVVSGNDLDIFEI